MINEAAYIETMKSCQKWNNKNVTSRINSGVFDQQTGIEQKPTENLYRTRLERYVGTNPLQVCSYPAKRYKRSKEFSSEACEFNHFRSTYPEINSTIAAITNPPVEFMHPESLEQSSMPLRSTTNGTKTNAYDEDSMMDYDFDELDMVSDNDDGDAVWGSRRNKRKKNGREGGGRSVRRSAATSAAAAISVSNKGKEVGSNAATSSSSSESRPFVCTQCNARYKSRAGLSYHRLNVHGDRTMAQDMNQSSATPSLNILASSILDANLDVSTICDLCQGGCEMNKKTNQPEQLVNCHDCGRAAHPSCVGFTSNMIISTKKYGWQCIECKSCTICGTSDNDDALLFCDDCDRGFHLYCLKPALKTPPEGNWSCQLCVKEFSQQHYK